MKRTNTNPTPTPAPSTVTEPVPPQIVLEPTFSAGKRLYAEMFGDAIVTATYLKLTIAVLSLIIFALAITQLITLKTLRQFKPLIVRIDSIGRAETVRYDDLAYSPQEAEIKYFLADFVRLYYSRNKATIKGNYAKFLAYLSPSLAGDIIAAWENQKIIETVTRAERTPIDIDIRSISLEDLRARPIRARVDYEQILYVIGERTEAKRVTYTANIALDFATGPLPPAVTLVNPLGIMILQFREDEAISK
jgi:type IV secretory pathway component VirB8